MKRVFEKTEGECTPCTVVYRPTHRHTHSLRVDRLLQRHAKETAGESLTQHGPRTGVLPALSAPLCVNTAIRFRCLRIRYGHSEVRKAEGEELTNLRKGCYLPFGWIPVLLALSCVLGGWGFVCWPTEPTWVALAAPDGVGFLK